MYFPQIHEKQPKYLFKAENGNTKSIFYKSNFVVLWIMQWEKGRQGKVDQLGSCMNSKEMMMTVDLVSGSGDVKQKMNPGDFYFKLREVLGMGIPSLQQQR